MGGHVHYNGSESNNYGKNGKTAKRDTFNEKV